MCLKFHLWNLVERVRDDIDDYHKAKGLVTPDSAKYWINRNLNEDSLHRSAVQPILDLYRCSKETNGEYECEND
jgi:hypothetical protein